MRASGWSMGISVELSSTQTNAVFSNQSAKRSACSGARIVEPWAVQRRRHTESVSASSGAQARVERSLKAIHVSRDQE